MELAYLRFRVLPAALLAAALGAPTAGCILSPDDDDDAGADGTESGPSGPGTNSASDPSVGTSGTSNGTATSPSTTNGSDTDGPPQGCGDNLLGDPGFEAGTPNTSWQESSAVFGTPICDVNCTEQPGAEPYAGDWWVWFGGVEQQETASVSQAVIIAPDMAVLQFRFNINTGAGNGSDTFTVDIDGNTEFMVTDLDQADYGSYTLVDVDISQYADGEEHTLTFEAQLSGVGLTNFFLDDVLLVSCSEDGTGTTDTEATGSGSTTDPTETATDTDVSTTADTDTDTDSTTDPDTGSGSGSATEATTGA